ncbi:hypothetical protein FOL47_004473 [Perkinsus chesapeaki]|uniref:Uncharacterized protein n=1 Tax=Perkinsus chesapeaki TaxID=330153 RepID=A0A7J6KJS1_PERCH|nr:hypothetical protein FOL47_004473 [Perkinsus chesapeaki]
MVLTYLCVHSKDLIGTVVSDMMHSKDAGEHVTLFYTFPGINIWGDFRAQTINDNGFNITLVDNWLGCMTVQENPTQLNMFNGIACIMAADWQNLTRVEIKECISSNGMDSSEVERCATGEAAWWLQEKAIQDTRSMYPPFTAFPTVNVGHTSVFDWAYFKEFVCNEIGGM